MKNTTKTLKVIKLFKYPPIYRYLFEMSQSFTFKSYYDVCTEL